MTSAFARLGVPESLAAVLAAREITTPTPIQTVTLPDSLAGRDVLGRGRTGSGKTYAFSLPLVARLLANNSRTAPGRPRALVLAPTRELATQIAESIKPLAATGRLATLTLFGGTSQGPQVRALRAGIDILVATPGRLLDLCQQGSLSLANVAITVIDEADHMSDMGFLPSVRKILAMTPQRSQRLLFSATLDNAVNVLAKQFLHDLVIHADPPEEHKAYLHRSGRTDRAGQASRVVTIAIPSQRQDVKELMRAARITPRASALQQVTAVWCGFGRRPAAAAFAVFR